MNLPDFKPLLPYPVIGFAGKARTGKDTAVSMLLEMADGYRYAFADPIKRMTDALGIERGDDTNKEEVIPELGVSRRHMWQTLGTEWGRNLVNKDIWLILAKWELDSFGPGMVISDVRFENEADWIRSQGGRIVHISRKDAPKITGSSTHQSEAGIEHKYGDFILYNDGTLDQLRGYLLTLIRS
jgi:hypothetical protein